MGLLLAVLPVACHKEEQAVVGVAQTAVNAEQRAQQAAQAAASESDRQRAALAQIPLPTKSLYADVHEASAWANPFLTVGINGVVLRNAAEAVAQAAPGKALKPQAHTQELSLAALPQALTTLPAASWRYGRVMAVAEAQAPAKDRPAIRRNMEQVIQKLNDLGIVVEEWPSK